MPKIAFAGAAGTGKSTLAKWLYVEKNLPFCDVTTRDVAKRMGFDSPYDVDAAGKRTEFQLKYLEEKLAWESKCDSFVTERSYFDMLAYFYIHNPKDVNQSFLDAHINAQKHYTHLIYLDYRSFCNTASDPSRINDMAYQQLYNIMLEGIIKEFSKSSQKILIIRYSDLAVRKSDILDFVYNPEFPHSYI